MSVTQTTPAPDWRPPWQSLPDDLAERLAPAIPGIMERIIETVPDQIPAYAAARDGHYGKNLTAGVTTALEQLMSLPGTTRPALNSESRVLMARLGAGEFREGRSMDALLGAYRTSARIVFRELSAECARLGLEMSVVIELGESIWAYIDELSSVSAQAYAEAQSAQAGVLELHRAALATALVRGGTEEKEVQRLAALADWRLPRRLAVVVLPADAGVAVRERLGRAGLVVERDSEVVAVIDATPSQGRRERMLRLLAGTAAFLGHLFPVWLRFRGGKGVATFLGTVIALAWPVGLVACATWLATAAVTRISSLAALVAAAVAPLAALALGQPRLAAATALMAAMIWLRHRDNIARIAAGTEPRIGRKG